ncbi:MAG: hypothetical protein ACR2L2_13990 [Acidobacteriota bacterium]
MKPIAIRAVLAGFLLVCLATPLPQGAGSARIQFEWETRWHPEIEDPAVAIPQFIQFVRKSGRR